VKENPPQLSGTIGAEDLFAANGTKKEMGQRAPLSPPQLLRVAFGQPFVKKKNIFGQKVAEFATNVHEMQDYKSL
jgi:hypothetical protein